ncbi:MAG: DUF4065 domain-containing protein [Candidatus Omnitrophica bacterium]|nr:DUF4065 domain-containing protein [Candidatus Omnitrophota bacterium]
MDKNDILLILLYADGNTPIVGTTRFQKLLFLIEQEKKIKPEKESFGFEAYKFGPASKKLYDDLDTLVNMGFMQKTGENAKISEHTLEDIETLRASNLLSRSATKEEEKVNEIVLEEFEDITNSNLSAELKENENLMSDITNDAITAFNEEKTTRTSDDLIVYKITQKGIMYLENNNLLTTSEKKEIDNIKRRYAKIPLSDLLRYVYRKYPGYTTESEIRDEIL